MADLKISQLSDGGASQATDEYVVARSGNNFRIDGASVAAAATSVGTLSSLTVSGNTIVGAEVFRGADNSFMRLAGGNPSATGAAVVLFGSTHATAPGRVDINATGTGTFNVSTGSASPALTVSASGNLGLGVTPSAWASASYKAMDLNSLGLSLAGGSESGAMTIASYFSSGWKYAGNTTYRVSRYDQFDGAHAWYYAAKNTSGGAGAAISWTTAMTLDASGNLGVGATSLGNYRLSIEGSNAVVAVGLRMKDTGTSGREYTIRSDAGAFIIADNTAPAERARITSGGDFAIGSGAKLYLDGVAATGDTYLLESATNVVSLYTGGSESLYVASSQFKALGAYNNTTGSAANVWVGAGGDMARSTSSVRYKHDIESVDEQDAFDAVLAMRPITYRGKTDDDQRRYIGFLAEEMQEIAPLLCTYDEGGEAGTPNYVTYDRVAAYLVCAIQKQQKTIEALEARLAVLEA